MTEKTTPWRLNSNALVAILPIFLLFGCASNAQLPGTDQVTSATEPLADPGEQSLSSESTTASEQQTVAGIDEKNSIFFSLGSSTVNQREMVKLREIVTLLKSDRAIHVTLIGHANDNGSRAFNLAVADARVESVGRALRKSGVKALQIKKMLVGSEKVPGSCHTQECRRKMRRVELVVSRVL